MWLLKTKTTMRPLYCGEGCGEEEVLKAGSIDEKASYLVASFATSITVFFRLARFIFLKCLKSLLSSAVK